MSDKLQLLTDNKLWLAPLAGVTDRAYRAICKKNGAEVTVTEMVSADGLIHDFDRSFEYGYFTPEEKPIGIQIFGSNPDIMAEAVELILNRIASSNELVNPDFIDINMGCPVKKVVKREAGAALLRNLPLAGRIVRAVKDVLQGREILLSAKIRAGWDSTEIVAVEAAQTIAANGADFIIIHPRTRSQMYSGKSDWELISAVVEQIDIPVIGNGDIRTVNEAASMYQTTGCNSIMIGRGALGNPWLFSEIKKYLLTGKFQPLSYSERYKDIIGHFELMIKYKGYSRAVREMKTHLCYYTKGFTNGSKARNLINMSSDSQEILDVVGELYNG